VSKHSDSASWDYANGAQWVAPEEAFVVIDAAWGHNVGAGTAYRASRGRANVGKKPYAVAVCG